MRRRLVKVSTKKRKPSKWDSWDDSDSEADQYPNVLALIGPSGAGKSTLVYTCAKALGMNVIEISAGQLRSGAAVKKMIIEATQSHGMALSAEEHVVNLILFDEVS